MSTPGSQGRGRSFRTQFGGVDREAVRSVIDAAMDDQEELRATRQRLQDERDAVLAEVARIQELERSAVRVLVSAGDDASATRAAAHEQARGTIASAEVRAADLLRDAEQERERLLRELQAAIARREHAVVTLDHLIAELGRVSSEVPAGPQAGVVPRAASAEPPQPAVPAVPVAAASEPATDEWLATLEQHLRVAAKETREAVPPPSETAAVTTPADAEGFASAEIEEPSSLEADEPTNGEVDEPPNAEADAPSSGEVDEPSSTQPERPMPRLVAHNPTPAAAAAEHRRDEPAADSFADQPDPDAWKSLVARMAGPAESPSQESLDAAAASRPRTARRLALVGVVLAAVAIGVVVGVPSLRTLGTGSPEADPPAANAVAGSRATGPTETRATGGTASGDAPAVTAAAQPAPAASIDATAAGPAAPKGLVVRLRTLRECWVRVVVDGVSDERLVPANEDITLNARDQVVVRAGDAGALLVEVNGTDLGPLGPDGQVMNRRFETATWKAGQQPPTP